MKRERERERDIMLHRPLGRNRARTRDLSASLETIAMAEAIVMS